MWASPTKRLILSGTVALTMLGGLGAAASAAQANFLPPPPAGYLSLSLPYPGDPYAQCNLYSEPGGTFYKTLQVTGMSFLWNHPVTVTLQSVSPYFDQWGDVVGYKPNGFYSSTETWTTDGAGNVAQTSAPGNQPFPEIRSSYPPYFYLGAYEDFQATASERTYWVTRPAASNVIECDDYLPPAW